MTTRKTASTKTAPEFDFTAAERDALSRSMAKIVFEADGTIVEASEKFLQAVGYTEAEVVGEHHRLFVDPEEARSPAYTRFWEALRAGEAQSETFRRFGKGGQEIWIEATYTPVAGPDGHVERVVKFAADVTAKTTRAADRTSRLSAIHRSQAVIEFGLDGVVQKVNDNFLSALGYEREEVVGHHHRIFMDKEEAAGPSYEEFWRDLASGEVKSGQFRRIAKGGADVWIQATYNPILDPSGRPYKVVKFATDVTERVTSLRRFTQEMDKLIG
ncbi:MAG: PAS domain-containing protein, partial [Sandaracinaceae bacterium]